MEQDFLTTPTVFLSRYPTPIAALQSDKVLSVIKIAMSAVFLSPNPSRPSGYEKSLEIYILSGYCNVPQMQKVQ